MRLFINLLAGILVGFFTVNAWGTPEPEEQAAGKVPEALAKIVKLEIFTKDVPSPLFLTSPPDDPWNRVFIVSKRGKIFIHRDGKVDKEKPFLDLSKKVSSGYEQGLLGLAFHPRFQENGLIYVHLTDRRGYTRVMEFRVSEDDPDVVDPKSFRDILIMDGQPYAGHNAALPVFGPDGKLYIATGDGGFGNRPGTGQDKKTPFGKTFRVNVDTKWPRLEMIHMGLRNPWRYSFDRKTGDLYIADVGHNKYEEVNFIPASKLTGHNFGWSIVEGNGHCFKKKTCDQTGFTQPVFEYGRKVGCSITGGYVYRGKALPELEGAYFYADFCTGALRSFRVKENRIEDHWDWKPLLDPDDQLATLVSFGEDRDGELYLISLDGVIYKFTRASQE